MKGSGQVVKSLECHAGIIKVSATWMSPTSPLLLGPPFHLIFKLTKCLPCISHCTESPPSSSSSSGLPPPPHKYLWSFKEWGVEPGAPCSLSDLSLPFPACAQCHSSGGHFTLLYSWFCFKSFVLPKQLEHNAVVVGRLFFSLWLCLQFWIDNIFIWFKNQII